MHIKPESDLPLSSEEWRTLKEGVKRFEDAWRNEKRPSIDAYLPADDSMRRLMLIELVHIDLELRLKAGERARIEDYLSAYQTLANDRAAILDLVAAEHHLRRRSEPGLSAEEYSQRFPQYRLELPDLIADATVADPNRLLSPAVAEAVPVVAGYEITGLIGRGGMGIVYHARQLSLLRPVALKFLPEACARDPVWLERFRREAHTASALNHPNICTIYDTGECAGRPFLCMELILGETFEALIARRRPIEVLIELFRQAADALAAAHAAGVLHRDIKPQNLMVRADGIVKVLDFGLARRLHARGLATPAAHDTEPGTRVGTVRYMSPEQARAEPLGSASDLFSLGLVFYELTTGQYPFTATSEIAILDAIIADAALPASRLNPEIPAYLDSLIQRMLQKEPAHRPTAAEVSATLLNKHNTPRTRATSPIEKRHTVGRAEERRRLRTGFESACVGNGRMFCVTGEPGLGKTTFVDDFLDELAADGHAFTLARGRCSERLAGSEAYLPILEALDSFLQSEHGASIPATMKELAPTWYAQLAPPSAKLLANLNDASQERRKREFVGFLKEVSLERPIVLFLDDVHWADPSSVDLLAYLGNQCARLPLLLVVTYRPSDLLRNQHPFGPIKLDLEARGACAEIGLAFLDRAELDQYIHLIYSGHGFPDDFAAIIHAKTEGNPLFMVDLLRYLHDGGTFAKEEDRWILARPLPDLQRDLPASVRGMIQRKVDQLSQSDRQLLTAGSVQGAEFDSAVVAAVLGREAVEVEERLSVLERVYALVRLVRELEYPNGTLTMRYRFVHVLYQHAFYAALPPTRRANWSSAAAKTLLRHHGEKSPAVATELAILFEAARDPANAVSYFLLAAHNAIRLCAHDEGVALAARGLALLEKLTDSSTRAQHELPLLLTLGVSLVATKGLASPEVEQAYLRARALCQRVKDEPNLFPVLYGLWNVYLVRCELNQCDQLADQMLQLAQQKAEPVPLMMAYNVLHEAQFHRGNFLAARKHQEAGLALYRNHEPRKLTATYGEDPGVSFLMYGAITLWHLGYPDQALQSMNEGNTVAGELANPFNIARAWYFCALTHLLRREFERTVEVAANLVELCDEHAYALLHAGGTILHGYALTFQGDVDRSIEQMRSGLSAWQATGAVSMRPFQLGLLADALGRANRCQEAIAAITEALGLCATTGERFWEAELHRVRGELAGDEEAEGWLRASIRIAREQNAKSLELRSMSSLSRLYLRTGRRAEARRQLSEICGWFTEGFPPDDVVDAMALLEELS